MTLEEFLFLSMYVKSFVQYFDTSLLQSYHLFFVGVLVNPEFSKNVLYDFFLLLCFHMHFQIASVDCYFYSDEFTLF